MSRSPGGPLRVRTRTKLGTMLSTAGLGILAAAAVALLVVVGVIVVIVMATTRS